MLTNLSDDSKPAIILPDGRVDVSFSFDVEQNLYLHGLETQPSQVEMPPRFRMFSVSFRPLALEYMFKNLLPILPDIVTILPTNFFGVTIQQFTF